ncbi:hypothetical protein AGMMS49592_3290 [Endomicrobiia bacterium]|nr:hypothetical protein AGMMS49592_3290 [Endomicrobiia bacterium]
MKLKAISSIFVAFSFALSSCDQKNARLVNRRTATPERIEKIKEAQRAKAREKEKLAVTPLKLEPVSKSIKEKEPAPDSNKDSVTETVTEPKAEGSSSNSESVSKSIKEQ